MTAQETKLSELLRARAEAAVALRRAENAIESYLAALTIRSREASALGSGIKAPARPRFLPPSVQQHLRAA